MALPAAAINGVIDLPWPHSGLDLPAVSSSSMAPAFPLRATFRSNNVSSRFYGTFTLTHRPLSCSMMILENDGAAKTIQRNGTFRCTYTYV